MLCRASFGLCGVVSILLDIPGLAPAELSFHYCRSGCMDGNSSPESLASLGIPRRQL